MAGPLWFVRCRGLSFVFFCRLLFAFLLLLLRPDAAFPQTLTLVELNCENLFDCYHDSLKRDTEFTPDGQRRWTPARYWRKLNRTGQAILSCSDAPPALVALVEVENDSVMLHLTRRSLLRNAGYEYLMTQSPDVRGIDVALLYQPSAFRPLCYETLRVEPLSGMRPTRDILYVKGEICSGDTLHVFVVHAPSRMGGERATRAHRRVVAQRLLEAVDSVSRREKHALVLAAGDFNTTLRGHSMRRLLSHGLSSATAKARGSHGAKASYRYRGEWEQIDHVLVSPALQRRIAWSHINDAPFLLEKDDEYGGVKPFRTFSGNHYRDGFSDHLPVVVGFAF